MVYERPGTLAKYTLCCRPATMLLLFTSRFWLGSEKTHAEFTRELGKYGSVQQLVKAAASIAVSRTGLIYWR